MSLWDLADRVFPYAHILYLRGRLRSKDPTRDQIDGWYTILVAGDDGEVRSDIAREIFESDIDRLDRLEAKLDSQRSILTAISPVTTVAIAASVADHNVAALITAVFAAAHLGLAFLVALPGSAASRRFQLSPATYREILAAPKKVRAAVAALEVASAEANQLHGVRLNNWLTCAQTSVAWSVVATVVSLLLLLPSHLQAK